jgi:hypothetical protein
MLLLVVRVMMTTTIRNLSPAVAQRQRLRASSELASLQAWMLGCCCPRAKGSCLQWRALKYWLGWMSSNGTKST